jgi:hypothetical protein
MINIHFDYSKVEGSTELHNKFKKEFMISVAKEFFDVVVIPYDVSFVRAYSEPERCFQVGQAGVPDIIVLGNGFYFLLDTKTGKNNLRPNQKVFKTRIAGVNKGVERVYKINSVSEGLEIIRPEYEANR